MDYNKYNEYNGGTLEPSSKKGKKVYKSKTTKDETKLNKPKMLSPVRVKKRRPIIKSDATRSNKILNIFNKIVSQGSQLFNKIYEKYQTQDKNLDQAQTLSKPIEINSLIVAFPSCHSETTSNTYLQNYEKFVKSQTDSYDSFIGLLCQKQNNNNKNKNMKQLNQNQCNQLELTKQQGYISVSTTEFEKLFDTNSSSFITAVSQGTCALAGTNKSDPSKYTPDAQIMSIFYDLSKTMLQKIKEKKSINSQIINDFMQIAKEKLRKEDYHRYKRRIYETYKNNVTNIVNDLDYILEMIEYIKGLDSNYKTKLESTPFLDYIVAVQEIKEYFEALKIKIEEKINEDVNEDVNANFIIPVVTDKMITDPDSGNKDVIENDIDCLIFLRTFIEKMSDDSDFGSEFKNAEIINIDKIYENHIDDWINNNIPLYLTSNENDVLLLQEIENDSLWKSEVHNMNSNDTSMQFSPNPDETRFDFDCQYGVNIMAAARTCPTKKKCINFFGLSPYLKVTRQKAQQQLSYEKTIESSGTGILEDKTWRYLGIIYFFDNFLNMFLEKHVKEEHQEQSKMVIFMYMENMLVNLQKHIQENIEELKQLQEQKEQKEQQGQIIQQGEQELIDEKYAYIEDIVRKTTAIENAQSKIFSDANVANRLASVNFVFENDELSRTYDFIKILENILYREQLNMSILKYYLQYLINFGYSVYVLPSCRIRQSSDKRKYIEEERFGGQKYTMKKRNLKNIKKKSIKRISNSSITNKRNTRKKHRQQIRKKQSKRK